MKFEVEVYRDEAGDWVAEAVEYKVTAKGRTEPEALARVMDALALHFKRAAPGAGASPSPASGA